MLATSSPATADSFADEQIFTDELKSLTDPTILKPAIWLDSEWNELKHGGGNGKETVAGLWAWGVSGKQDWAVGLELPFAYRVAGDLSGDSDEHGLGDIDVAAGAIFRLAKSLRTGGGLELRFPSAADDLGGGVWRMKPFWRMGWDATEQLTLAPSVEYNQSVAEEPGAARQSFLEAFLPATYLLPRLWSMTPQYEAKVDFENDNHWTHSARFSVAKRSSRAPMSLVASIKKPFDDPAKEFQVNFIVTYFLQ